MATDAARYNSDPERLRTFAERLPCRYPHDVDGVADDIVGALLALGSLGHVASIAFRQGETRAVMRNFIICLGLSLGLLTGCTYDYEAAQERAIETAKKQCESEGKQFQFVSERVDAEHRAAVLVSHCLGPGDPGYVPPAPAK
jgi:hypothetical protein